MGLLLGLHVGLWWVRNGHCFPLFEEIILDMKFQKLKWTANFCVCCCLIKILWEFLVFVILAKDRWFCRWPKLKIMLKLNLFLSRQFPTGLVIQKNNSTDSGSFIGKCIMCHLYRVCRCSNHFVLCYAVQYLLHTTSTHVIISSSTYVPKSP